MSLTDKINQDIKTAMLAKDADTLRGLRAIKAALLLAKTEKNSSESDEETEIKMLQKLAKQRKESMTIYLEQNREDLAKIEEQELVVINNYLPKQLSEEEIFECVRNIISNTGASGVKDMGKVMGIATKELAGKADGKIVSEIVKKALSA